MENKYWPENPQSYEFFLFSMLYGEIYKEESENMAYDYMYSEIVKLHQDFTNSPYDDGDIHLYDCIVDFLKDSKQIIITYAKEE